MIAIPSGASAIGTSQRWIRNRSPGNHSKVTRAPISAGGGALKVATSLHSPTNGLRASSEPPLFVLAVIAFLLLDAVHPSDVPFALMRCSTWRFRRWMRRDRITSTAGTRAVVTSATGSAQPHQRSRPYQTNPPRRRGYALVRRSHFSLPNSLLLY